MKYASVVTINLKPPGLQSSEDCVAVSHEKFNERHRHVPGAVALEQCKFIHNLWYLYAMSIIYAVRIVAQCYENTVYTLNNSHQLPYTSTHSKESFNTTSIYLACFMTVSSRTLNEFNTCPI